MPYKISEADGGYKVTSPHGTKAKKTTKAKAKKQVRLLNAIEHGFEPTKGKKKKVTKKPSKQTRRRASRASY